MSTRRSLAQPASSFPLASSLPRDGRVDHVGGDAEGHEELLRALRALGAEAHVELVLAARVAVADEKNVRALERARRQTRREALNRLLRVVRELGRLVVVLRRREILAAGPALRRRDAVAVLAVLAGVRAGVLVVARRRVARRPAPSPSGSGGPCRCPEHGCESSQKSSGATHWPSLHCWPVAQPLSSRQATHFPSRQTPLWPSVLQPSSLSQFGYFAPSHAATMAAAANETASRIRVGCLIGSTVCTRSVGLVN